MAPRYSFAYGSNTDALDWRAWCARTGHDPASLKPIGTGILPDARLAFDFFGKGRGGGVLNFQPRLGGYVEGVVLEVSEAGWRALDQKEGVPNAYQRRARHIILPDGQALEAIAYQVIPERQQGHIAPSLAYLNAVRRGFAAHGLHPHPLEAAAMGAEGCHMLADVFVYGTLMQGGFWHAPAAEAGIAAITPAQATGTLFDLGDFPALTLGEPTPIKGEILTFQDIAKALPVLDEIEDAAPDGTAFGMYRRTIIMVTDHAGQHRRAWAYVMAPETLTGAPIIASGNWRRHQQKKRGG
ncbi:MAG: gamma-glutamylcyclotransferase [Roseomonas sp.]|nr:gamma-glutamylcyclotransferase [Roseomonas sp.]MCA3283799.1 gamma-glutamylcyclotransferase [Roseomonas sp.]MCA3297774.1 gamma-glutamylcyclotransferase [Roseomonas sp.]